ncbi:hypothetical protein GCM10010393_46040 [Streptomyces gobitricini]|uniref:Uncharacterized protein n=1 Tax=Streptomyces gobitricini TaxID=68211 RepID=A0ABP5ZZZ0_9ACTN
MRSNWRDTGTGTGTDGRATRSASPARPGTSSVTGARVTGDGDGAGDRGDRYERGGGPAADRAPALPGPRSLPGHGRPAALPFGTRQLPTVRPTSRSASTAARIEGLRSASVRQTA